MAEVTFLRAKRYVNIKAGNSLISLSRFVFLPDKITAGNPAQHNGGI
jgi:hypothetical protein